jgi:hypothetical protein
MVASVTVTIPFELEAGNYSPEFLEAVRGAGAWSREARIVIALAAARGIRLDERELALDDTHDLRARREALARPGSHA